MKNNEWCEYNDVGDHQYAKGDLTEDERKKRWGFVIVCLNGKCQYRQLMGKPLSKTTPMWVKKRVSEIEKILFQGVRKAPVN